MCFAQGSLDQATKPCPMCKVFKPSGARCPHVKDICRNRAVHPRYDVVHFKNAEVQTFNGCGYCKWAKAAPLPRSSGVGWPGCCRAPASGENRYIQAADWPAVSIVHHVPIPPEVKSILDSIGVRGNASSPQSPQSTSPTATLGRSAGGQVTGIAPIGRRSSASAAGKPEPSKRSSPPQTTSPLTRSSRTSLDNNSPVRGDRGDSSPSRRQVDLDSSIAHRSAGRRPSLSSAMSPPSSSIKANPEDRDRRRPLNTINTGSVQRSAPSRPQGKTTGLESAMAGLAIPSSPSSASSSSGGSSDHTVDGGFTDYLSDESDAELQRQAEIKAALVAQNRMEEQEFRAARQQLANVDLRPPRSWNPDTNGSRGSQPIPAYTSAPFANATYARV